MSEVIFDESFYLSNYPDVKAAVDTGGFSSGLQHFQLYGLAAGRVLVSPFYDEQFYLQTNPDVAASVASGAFSSGLQHYIQFGEAEGRSAGPFNEDTYLLTNPDVAAAVDAGAFSSGLQHYIQYGQFEENRIGSFFGTSGNDLITGVGEGNELVAGVSIDALLTPGGGVGEVDTLISGEGTDLFALGFPSISPLTSMPQQFYVGGGNTDYALIQKFERFTGDFEQFTPGDADIILLAGSSQDYNLQAVNGSLNISTASGDLVAIVEGVTSLSPPIDITSDVANFAGIPSDSVGSVFVIG